MKPRPPGAPDSAFARQLRLAVLLPLLAFGVLILTGVTNSNIGVSLLREDPSHPVGRQFFGAQAIRSDEYLTESPLWLGQMAVGLGQERNPLTVSPDFFAQLPDGPVSAVVFFDGTLLRLGAWLPTAMLFAFKWWLPTLLLVIGMPLWFRQVTGSWRWGYFGALLVLVSPASIWWSGRPVNTLGFMFMACALGIRGAEHLDQGHRWRFAAYLLVAGILLARFPTYYQPLAIVIGLPVAVATGGYLLLRSSPRRLSVVSVAALTLSGAIWTGLLILENLTAVRAGLDTIYPGARHSTSESLTIGRVLSATNLGWLKSVSSVPGAMLNPTELSTSFTVLLAVLVVLLVSAPWKGHRSSAAAFWLTATSAAFWLSWCTLDWGSKGMQVPLANLVPGFRAANGVGFVAVVAFCLFMPQWDPPENLRVPVGAALVAAFASAWAGSSLQATFLPALTPTMVLVSAGVAGACVFALTNWPGRWPPMVAAAAAAGLLTFSVNPVLVGVGDLRDSGSAKMFLAAGAAARQSGTLWVSDSKDVDALMMATGTPAISSRQQIGPDLVQWERLDPGKAHEQVWNRGGSHITYAWAQGPAVLFSNPSLDVVLVTASPCSLARRIPELAFAVSSHVLSDSCLVQVGSFDWSGETHLVYAISGAR